MTVLEQYSALLNGIEDTELKEKLTTAFDGVTGAFNDAINTRDKQKTNNKDLAEFKNNVAELFGLGEDFTIDDVKSQHGDVSKIKEDLTKKHENDLNLLRSELKIANENITSLTGKNNDMLFNSAIVESGLLDGFVDEPMARTNIIGMIRDQLLYEDGNVFVKDSTTGDKAKDVTSGEYLSPKSVIENVKGTINPMYLNPDVKGQGGGTPPRGNQNNGSFKRGSMSAEEKGAYIRENGQEAYLKLPN